MTFNTLTGSVPFEGADGIEYQLKPLTIPLLSEFVTWVQYKPYRDALIADLPAKICKSIRLECSSGWVSEEVSEDVFKEFPISFNSSIVHKILYTTPGFTKFVQISLCIDYPKFKNNEAFAELLSDDNLSDVFEPLLLLNEMIEDPKKQKITEKNVESPNQNQDIM